MVKGIKDETLVHPEDETLQTGRTPPMQVNCTAVNKLVEP